jgi:F0F1-type ATP synthase alpha subunit
LKAGVLVRRTFRVVSVLVNPYILGRVIDPLGKPLDG